MMRSFRLYKTLLIASLCLVLLLAADAQECSNPEVCVSTDGKIGDQSSSKVAEDPKCPSRGQIIRCAGTHLDLDKNGKLERAELQQAIDQLPWYVALAFNVSSPGPRAPPLSIQAVSPLLKYISSLAELTGGIMPSCFISLHRLARGVLNILGSVDSIMKKCDVDGDDAIGMDYDMSHNGDTCLATCFKRRAFKRAFFSECEL
jgi:hypothetical protein